MSGYDITPPRLVCDVNVTLVFSAADMGELLQCSYGHQDPGRLHGGEANGSGPHHRGRHGPDLQW